MPEQIEQYMRTLKLGGMAREWRSVEFQSKEQYVRELLELELREREANRINRMVKTAGFQVIKTLDEYFDGVRCRLSLWAWDNYESYHLDDWDAPDDERMMMAIYYSEQVHPVPRYKNDLEKSSPHPPSGTTSSPNSIFISGPESGNTGSWTRPANPHRSLSWRTATTRQRTSARLETN